MKKKILFSTLLIIFVTGACNMAYAERKLLAPPPPVSFNAEKYLDDEFKDKLDKLKEKIKKHKDEKLNSILSGIYNTTRKKTAQKLANEMAPGISKYKKKDHELFALFEEISKDIESRKFNKKRFGVDFKVDKKRREYIFSWDEDGNDIVKRTPFAHEMKLIVKGDYGLKVKDGNELMVYRYWVDNKKGSKAPFKKLYLENAFPKLDVMDVLKSNAEWVILYDEVKKDKKLTVIHPIGRVNYFRFHFSNPNTGMIIYYHPGEQMDDPFVLGEIEGGLPGIIKCYVEVPIDYFNPHGVIDAEGDPQIAVDVLSGRDETFTMYMHSTNTIGPVPLPDPFDRDGFIEKIISINEQSIVEGWNDRPPVIEFTREGLEEIKNDPGNKERIKEFLTKLDVYNKRKQILSEAYALLKYNLEYLLSKMK